MVITLVTMANIILALILWVVVFSLITRYKRAVLRVCYVFVVVGFVLYTAAYFSSGTGLADAMLAALRGIISTARMFTMNDDYHVLVSAQGTQWLTENPWLKILMWLCYVSSLIILQTALVALFGRELVAKFRLCLGWFHKEVYIINGAGKNAFLLGENIATHDQKGYDNKRLVAFLLEDDDDEKKNREKTTRQRADHFGAIVQMLDRENNLLSCLKKADLLRKWFRCKRKYKIILMPEDAYLSDNIRGVLDYAKKEKIPAESMNIFALTSSQWDKEEIEAIIQEKKDNERKYPYSIHITNEVDIITRQMVEKHPPFKCEGLNFNEKGEAARDFTVMILGFGNVGQHALLRLVMNGQFVGSSMRAIIVDSDEHINNLRDSFLYRYPELKLCCDVEFKKLDVRSEEFFALLNNISNVDYMVITLCGDDINKQTALDIRLHYERKNRGLPFIAVSEKKGGMRKVKQDERIFIFGCCEDVYKESVIIRADIDLMAKAVHEAYKKIYGGQPWHEIDCFDQESNRATADFIPAMLKLAGFVEKENGEMKENEKTEKITLAEKGSPLAEILAQTEHLRWNAFHAAAGWRSISIEEMRQRFADAQDKGLCRKNPKLRLHVCLAPWNKLDEISEAYSRITRKEEDFKESDRKIIENVPSFLEEAEKGLCKITPSKDISGKEDNNVHAQTD